MNRPRRGYVDGPHGQIHYRRMGSGRPLVLCHQAAMDARQFDAVHPLLAARGFDVIAFDMPGFGMSDATPFVPSVEDLAQSVAAGIAALDTGPVAVAGHHTGAMVATELALDPGTEVTALVLNGPMPVTGEERSAFFAEKQPREKDIHPKPGGEHFRQFAAIRERLTAGSVPTGRIHDYVIQALGAEAPFWYGHNAGFNYRHEESLLRIEVPTMILTNTGDQIYEHALRAHALRPDMAFVALDAGGVDIVDQQPEAWVAAVADFVTR